MLGPNFWDDKRNSESVISELNGLKSILNSTMNLKNKIQEQLELINLLKEDLDEEIKDLVTDEISEVKKSLEKLELIVYLSGPHDNSSAIVEIHAGAGGTESQDWASMVYRMYTRWASDKEYKVEILNEQDGDEAGIKGVTFIVKGLYAYGYLKAERGVHRLVRISPFDSNSRRHTSFCSVEITPLFENKNIDIEIKESDLKIDVYRSSGAGGQSVNTTDSAVRITHLPTKIVVTCQNERSQIQNREKALEILKNKLYQLEIEKRDKELKNIKGDVMDVNFGSQIRSYVMHPYSMVKDHRTNIETSNVEKVLDGDIDMFINGYLKVNNYQ